MQPRGQLWFELQRVVQDFRAYNGLDDRDSLKIMIAVLRNLLNDTEEELRKLDEAGGTGAGSPGG